MSEVDVFINEDRFLLSALTRACKFKNDTVNMTLPIRKGMLRILLNTTFNSFMLNQQPYLAHLYTALFSTAYFGLFRVGEVTKGSHPIMVQDVHLACNKKKVLFILRSSKTHSVANRPQSVKITSSHLRNNTNIAIFPSSKQDNVDTFCPYLILRNYMDIRPEFHTGQEPFFVFRENSAVTPVTTRKLLKENLKSAGFDPSNYNCQSLRIGQASDLLKMGVSVETIKKLERWSSDAVFSYLHTL